MCGLFMFMSECNIVNYVEDVTFLNVKNNLLTSESESIKFLLGFEIIIWKLIAKNVKYKLMLTNVNQC